MRYFISIPSRLIGEGERIVLLDDIAWTGGTILTLNRLASRLKGKVAAVYLLAAFKTTLQRLEEEMPGIKIRPFITLGN